MWLVLASAGQSLAYLASARQCCCIIAARLLVACRAAGAVPAMSFAAQGVRLCQELVGLQQAEALAKMCCRRQKAPSIVLHTVSMECVTAAGSCLCCRRYESIIQENSQPKEGSQPLNFDTKFAKNTLQQFVIIWRKFMAIYWR